MILRVLPTLHLVTVKVSVIGIGSLDTVKLKRFREGLFSRNFASSKFREIAKSLFVGKSDSSRDFLHRIYNVCLFTLFAKIKLMRKINEFANYTCTSIMLLSN